MVPSDSYITNHLFWLGIDGYEAGEPSWWATLVRSHASVLELGANVGLYTIVGAAAADRPYTAVEPNPTSCAALRRNLALNGLEHVRVVEAAVVGGRADETVTLRFPDRDLYRASAGAYVDGALDLTTASARSVTVPAVTGADLVAEVDLVKLDIEGLEVEVLSSVRSWIMSDRPTLVVEVRDDATHLQSFVRRLVDDAGYACTVVVDGAVRRLPAAEASTGRLEAHYRTRDVTLIDPARLDRALAQA
jgi:FkbM family methyltransferase